MISSCLVGTHAVMRPRGTRLGSTVLSSWPWTPSRCMAALRSRERSNEGLMRVHVCAGVAVFSRRALPLAAWTNGLEIAAVKADVAVRAGCTHARARTRTRTGKLLSQSTY